MVDHEPSPRSATSAPIERVVLLGASNLSRGFSTLLCLLRTWYGPRLEVLAAPGHGRSYGMRSQVLARAIPGTRQCGLWQDLASRPRAPTVALVTDIGNDLLYGASIEQIGDWVGTAIDRLREAGATTVVTRPPVENLPTVSAWKYGLLRRLMFPTSNVDWPTMLHRAQELDEMIAARFSDRDGIHVAKPSKNWYGWDPIHVRRWQFAEAWSSILAPWPGRPRENERPLSPERLRFSLLRNGPEVRWWLGIEQRTAQPVAELAGGTRIWLY